MSNKKENYILFEVFTTKYLGREGSIVQLLDLVVKYSGFLMPEKWSADGKKRHAFDPKDISPIVKECVMAREFKNVCFSRNRPAWAELWIGIDRFEHAKFNNLHAFISDSYFQKTNEAVRLLDFITELCSMMEAAYGFIAHRKQEIRQSPVLTPAERLPGIYWANFFGQPYIDFFGRKELVATPCHEVREIGNNHILLLTAETPFQPEILENDEISNRIKAYLNQDSFAGPSFPNKACNVPQFDFSDVSISSSSPKECLERNSDHVIDELRAIGYKLVEQSQDQVTLQSRGKSFVVVDLITGSISLDVSKG